MQHPSSRILLLLSLFLLQGISLGAQLSQNIRGMVIDADSRSPLAGASVSVWRDSTFLAGAYSDEEGKFHIADITPGRVMIRAAYLGYEPLALNNIMVTTGKEVVLNLEMREKFVSADTVFITAGSRTEAKNEMATVSARPFTIEETQRFAGTKNDPARMAQNFAGVTGANDQRNDIVIRGNSPMGVLWRLEGVDIPNPNHFATFGTTGGPISMLNNNVLANSDFFTGAFPAEYGNAVAGVFDLKMRTGNNEQREFTGQFGMNGLELMAEGPFVKGKKASYLAAYRYNNLALYKKLGIKFGSSAIPTFTDFSFRMVFPTEKAGTFSVFGLGGFSEGKALDSERDTADFYGPSGSDIVFASMMGVAGVSNSYLLNEKTFIRTTLAASYSSMKIVMDTVERSTRIPSPFYRNFSNQEKVSLNSYLNHKISSRHTLKAGFFLDHMRFNLLDSVYLGFLGHFVTVTDFRGGTFFFQPYVQYKWRLSEKTTLNAGIHYQFFAENRTGSPEPRIGLKQQLGKRDFLGIAYGLHSQLQPLFVYFALRKNSAGEKYMPNHDLKMTRSHHAVISWDHNFGNDIRLRTECYYQRITGAGIEKNRSNSFSLLNQGADFWFVVPDSALTNSGIGRNMGAEITFEKFLSRNYYFLTTFSLYDSRYKGSDGVLRNTAFNGRYAANVLGGADLPLSKSKKWMGGINGKVTVAGGKRYTPIDPVLSSLYNRSVLIDSLAWTAQTRTYFRADIRFSVRLNSPRFSQELAFDISNLFNTKNVLFLVYDKGSGRMREVYQLGRLPVIQYKIEF